MLSTTQEIKKAFGSNGRKIAKEIFNQDYKDQWGKDFDSLVRNSIQAALSKMRNRDEVAQKLNANTVDSLARWIDK